MSKRSRQARASGRRRRHWPLIAIGAVLAVLVVAGAAGWWRPTEDAGGTGTPKLAVDRADIDLGYFRFETPVTASFVVTNTGDGPLRLEGSPPVKAVVGC